MSKVLPNLVMVFAFLLCGLCLYQWNREVALHKDMAAMSDDLYKKKESIQGLELNLRRASDEIARLEQVRKDLIQTKMTNEATIASLTNEVERLIRQKDAVTAQLEQYKKALDTANESIVKQNEDIKRQNEMLQNLARQRDEKIAELAKVVEEYNKLVKDYNKLVEDVNRMNEQAAAAAAAAEKKK
ncbi:MAG: hypothetical protein GX456_05395 [Verrucomicrobia bacterium]|nr:hypothetical protein [Verrucomicrobiota bacterium]